MIEGIALERGHEVILKIDVDNRNTLTVEELKQADAAIEFTAPSSAVGNINFCLESGVPIVVGTTGWYEHLDAVKETTAKNNGSMVYATNFSVGVNILFAMNKQMAKWMNQYPEYAVKVEETHHTQKLDSPSGTAITLAEGILDNISRKKAWQKQDVSHSAPLADDILKIAYDRRDGVPGIHEVKYTSGIDEIRFSHEAFNRKGFALGAVLGAEFIVDKKGIYTAADMFGF